MSRLPDSAPDPADRPRVRRTTARLLVVADDGRVLLFRDHDPLVEGFSWWNTPGGAIDPGETAHDAAVRELHEETGYAAGPGEVVGPVARRRVVHGYSDCVVDQEEVFFAVSVPAFDVQPVALTAAEQVMMLDQRWWDLTELEASGERVWPTDLRPLCALLDRPGQWPVDLPATEESSVAARHGSRDR